LADQLFTKAFEPGFLDRLELARSNLPEHVNGRAIYEKFVRPAMLGLTAVGAHYAISSLFQLDGERKSIYSYSAAMEDYRSFQAGGTKLVIGRAKVTSQVTRISTSLCFGVLHLGITASVAAPVNIRERRNMKPLSKRFQMLSPERTSPRPYFCWVSTSGRPRTHSPRSLPMSGGKFEDDHGADSERG